MVGGACVFFNGTISADDFFSGLERIDSPQGQKFLNRGRPVEDFPDRVLVTIGLIASPCPKGEKAPLTTGPDKLSSMSFETQWGLEGQPHQVSPDSSKGLQLADWSELTSATSYKFDLETAQKPLKDTFFVRVLSGSGKKIAEFQICLCTLRP
jgi:hypothetical protein